MDIRDNNYALNGRINSDGMIKDYHGNSIGRIRNGEIQKPDNSRLGSIKNGEIRSRDNSLLGTIKNGEVRYRDNSLLGTIKNGEIRDRNRNILGKSDASDEALAVIFFFPFFNMNPKESYNNIKEEEIELIEEQKQEEKNEAIKCEPLPDDFDLVFPDISHYEEENKGRKLGGISELDSFGKFTTISKIGYFILTGSIIYYILNKWL